MIAQMGWASRIIGQLQGGQTTGEVYDDARVTVEPFGDRELTEDDIVLVKAINGDQYLIGNKCGGINGWLTRVPKILRSPSKSKTDRRRNSTFCGWECAAMAEDKATFQNIDGNVWVLSDSAGKRLATVTRDRGDVSLRMEHVSASEIGVLAQALKELFSDDELDGMRSLIRAYLAHVDHKKTVLDDSQHEGPSA